MRHVAQGIPVTVIIVTDGAFNLDAKTSADDYVLQRQQESIAAAHILGYGKPIFWQYPDRKIGYNEKFVQEILETIQSSKADLIYAPSVFEVHPDHRIIGMAVVEAVRRVGKSMQIALYEVGVPLHPNQLLDISDLAERKAAAMSCFTSQIAKQSYDLHIAALNRYRTYTLPASVTAAEAYMLISAEELANDPLKLYQSEHTRQKTLGLVLDSNDVPLVSVIIRSMNRDTLSDALDSVALQTYSNIEIVIVNAKGADHRGVGEWCGGFPIRLIASDGLITRSCAANIGLEAAQGKYLIFLDDDDWFTADHIENLVRVIELHPHIKVVYSGAICVDENNKRMPKTFGQSFDAIRLLAENYIPIHTALFSKELLNIGCAIDEKLDVYEDWDFWIQASMFTDFLYVDNTTAVYRINPYFGSQVHTDNKLIEAATQKIYQKWLPRLNSNQISNLITVILSNQVKDEQLKKTEEQLKEAEQKQKQQLMQHKQQIDELQELIKELKHIITERDRSVLSQNDTIQEIMNSTSWRITQPMRWLVLHYRTLHSSYRKIRRLAASHGGFKALSRKVYLTVKQDGLSSLASQFSRTLTLSDSDLYQHWIEKYDHLTNELRNKMQSRSEAFSHKPLISIIMPTYNPNIKWLTEAIESVRKQIYPHWELCIADDASTDSSIHKVLQQFERQESRIKVVYRAQNGHISAASNSALQLATGEWVALLDHDDLLSEHALFWIVDALQNKPDIQLIYSDEDKINEQGKRLAPYFKPDWNKQLFYSQNFICHLSVFRRDILKKISGFKIGLEGSQDYDLILRYLEYIDFKRVHHIPRILYHWRMHNKSTAFSSHTKPYAILSGEKALNNHFERQKISATAEYIGFGYRIHYSLPSTLPLVSLIIPTKNGFSLLSQCVESILEKTTYKNYEILIIDNDSDDKETIHYLQKLSDENDNISIVKDDRPFNYSALNNEAVKVANGEILGLLNNDLEVISPEWLSEMVSIALQPDTGAVGAKLWYPNDTLQHGGVIIGIGGVAAHSHKYLPRNEYGYFCRARLTQNFSAVTAACLVIRKFIFDAVGGLNETDLQIAFNDIDFCLRVQEAGYSNIWTPFAELYHHESATRGYENTPKKQERFSKEVKYMQMKWQTAIYHDPAYNPNLTLDREDFSLADLPRTKFLSNAQLNTKFRK
ncbi:hypothetical protein W03_01940 [Nitrosomonas sp. PY1]|nr:hypothetical protein W03_01940 [Nitrosomonas sp. PY1]